MHKLCDYLTDELKELEDKVARGGKLSRAEIEDGKNIAKFKMALLTNDRMEQDGGESEMYPYMGGIAPIQATETMNVCLTAEECQTRRDAILAADTAVMTIPVKMHGMTSLLICAKL